MHPHQPPTRSVFDRSRYLAIGAAVLSLSASAVFAGAGVSDYVTSNPNPFDPIDGESVNAIVGADRFYANGFTGSSAIVANVEAGYIWNGHESLQHLTTFIAGTGAKAEFDRHATWVGMILGGRPTPGGGEYQRGMAYGATLWSASIATDWVGAPYTRSFDYSVQSMADAYKTALITGVDGKTADVSNSSWSDGSDPEAAEYGDYSRAVDAIALTSTKTLVFSAGNRGPSAGTVGTPGAGFNVITVASLGSDTSSPRYDSVSSFSSRAPQPIFIPNVRDANYFNPGDGRVVMNARAAVDIAAPGENVASAFYGGATGGNTGGIATPGNTNYTPSVSGTSFSSPSVAGGATLMADAARQRFGGSTHALDGRVMKANLLNSADKIPGWDNGQSLGGDGVIRTTQALDFASGAGRMNLNKAYDQLLSGTADVPGTVGGTISTRGWDFGTVAEGSPNDYSFAAPLKGGSTLTVTLDWFIDRSIDLATDATLETSFDDLTLQVRSGNTLIAESASAYNEVEHLNFTVPTTGDYSLRVLWAGEVWDLVNDANVTTYGLAWSGVSVPEPAMCSVVLSLLLTRRRRPKAE